MFAVSTGSRLEAVRPRGRSWRIARWKESLGNKSNRPPTGMLRSKRPLEVREKRIAAKTQRKE